MDIEQSEQTKQDTTPDALLEKIIFAVKAADDAKVSHASRSKEVGVLLLEAKKLHPSANDFLAYLNKVPGQKLTRAYECMAIAGGRTTDLLVRKATRDRVKKHRASLKKISKPAIPPTSASKPTFVSVTVTENAKVSAEDEEAKSAHFLAEFTFAAKRYLPQITVEADRRKVHEVVSAFMSSRPNAEAA
jgi:hypothetical protein